MGEVRNKKRRKKNPQKWKVAQIKIGSASHPLQRLFGSLRGNLADSLSWPSEAYIWRFDEFDANWRATRRQRFFTLKAICGPHVPHLHTRVFTQCPLYYKPDTPCQTEPYQPYGPVSLFCRVFIPFTLLCNSLGTILLFILKHLHIFLIFTSIIGLVFTIRFCGRMTFAYDNLLYK